MLGTHVRLKNLIMECSQEKSKLQTQTYIHHVIVMTGFVSATFYGRGGALIISVSKQRIIGDCVECVAYQ
jgi:hypothetical protein